MTASRRVGVTGAAKRAGLVFACVFSAFAWFFIAGEAMSDPGGWTGAGLVALWTVPLVGLAALSWFRPARAVTLLAVLVGVVALAAVWSAIAPGSWHSFENAHGPVRAIASFVLLLPLALLAWRRPRLGGALLLAVGAVPIVTAFTVHPRVGLTSTAGIAIPAALDGILFLLSGRAAR